MREQRDDALTSATPKLYQVRLRSGRTWTGTKREFMATHPDWWPYAREVQGDEVLELDFADADTRNPSRLPSSSRRYVMPGTWSNTTYEARSEILPSPIPARRSATTSATPRRKKRRLFGSFRAHPLAWLGIGMLLMLLFWTGFQWFGAWWQIHQDDVHYGRPRTAQYDVVVGHNDSPDHPTHLNALNLNRTVAIIELPGGDTARARIYKGPTLFGDGADLAPVTLTFRDPDHTGKPEMLVHVQDTIILYLNQQINGVWQFAPQPTQ